MATSGTYIFEANRTKIIQSALAELNVWDIAQPLSSVEELYCADQLNFLLKNLSINVNLWIRTEVNHTLTAGTESYTVLTGGDISTPRPLALLAARREDSNGNEVECNVVSREEYLDQPDKSTQSAALSFYYDPQITTGRLYVWPTGSATDTLVHLTFKRYLQDIGAATKTPDIPQEWQIYLYKKLAYQVSKHYYGEFHQDLKREVDELFFLLKTHDEESVSSQFQPMGY